MQDKKRKMRWWRTRQFSQLNYNDMIHFKTKIARITKAVLTILLKISKKKNPFSIQSYSL